MLLPRRSRRVCLTCHWFLYHSAPQCIPARTTDEPRLLVIGLLGGKHWSAVITYRGKTIRRLSVRRSRAEEVQLYEQL